MFTKRETLSGGTVTMNVWSQDRMDVRVGTMIFGLVCVAGEWMVAARRWF